MVNISNLCFTLKKVEKRILIMEKIENEKFKSELTMFPTANVQLLKCKTEVWYLKNNIQWLLCQIDKQCV